MMKIVLSFVLALCVPVAAFVKQITENLAVSRLSAYRGYNSAYPEYANVNAPYDGSFSANTNKLARFNDAPYYDAPYNGGPYNGGPYNGGPYNSVPTIYNRNGVGGRYVYNGNNYGQPYFNTGNSYGGRYVNGNVQGGPYVYNGNNNGGYNIAAAAYNRNNFMSRYGVNNMESGSYGPYAYNSQYLGKSRYGYGAPFLNNPISNEADSNYRYNYDGSHANRFSNYYSGPYAYDNVNTPYSQGIRDSPQTTYQDKFSSPNYYNNNNNMNSYRYNDNNMNYSGGLYNRNSRYNNRMYQDGSTPGVRARNPYKDGNSYSNYDSQYGGMAGNGYRPNYGNPRGPMGRRSLLVRPDYNK